MKITIAAAVLFALVSKGCAQEAEEEADYPTTEQSEYAAKDYEMRNAVAQWEQFRQESERDVMAARIRISKATDRLDNGSHNKRRLRSAIIEAESLLGQLSDLLLKAKEYDGKAREYELDELTLGDMEAFKESYRKKLEKLKDALEDMEKI